MKDLKLYTKYSCHDCSEPCRFPGVPSLFNISLDRLFDLKNAAALSIQVMRQSHVSLIECICSTRTRQGHLRLANPPELLSVDSKELFSDKRAT